MVYTYTGKKGEPCENCKELDILTVKDDKLYVLSYFADVKKYSELLSTIKNMINSTNIGFQTYKNLTSGFEIKYPNDWTRDSAHSTLVLSHRWKIIQIDFLNPLRYS